MYLVIGINSKATILEKALPTVITTDAMKIRIVGHYGRISVEQRFS